MNRYDYLPFGGRHQPGTSVTVEQRYTYTGRELNPTSDLMYYRYRQYDPRVGRFGGRDPIGYRGGINLFAYVGNDPTQADDPFGLGGSVAGYAGAATAQYAAALALATAAMMANDPAQMRAASRALTAAAASQPSVLLVRTTLPG